MRTIQAPSKLLLLNNQPRSRPAAWPKALVAVALLLLIAFNIGVIRARYSSSEAEPAASEVAPGTDAEPGSAGLERNAIEQDESHRSLDDRELANSSAPHDEAEQSSSLALEAALKDTGVDEPTLASAGMPLTSMAAWASATAAPEHSSQGAPSSNGTASVVPPLSSEPLDLRGDDDCHVVQAFVPGAVPGSGHALASKVVSTTIRPGQAVASAMMEVGLSGEQAHLVVTALRGIFDFRRARPGEGFRIKLSAEGELDLFDYERSPIESYVVQRQNGSLVAFKREIEAERELVKIEGEIQSSLFGAVESAGADAALAVLLANVLAWDVDFYRDPRRGDRFRVVVERYHHRGRHLRYGEVLAAEYRGAVGDVRLFRYERSEHEVAYYDEKGNSAQRAFLRAPLQVARVTSGFGNRRHPILGYSRQHRGVDYGAPTGTPVWAVGDGTVITAGRQGAYGNLIVLRHNNGYSTWYAHLSRINVKVGQRVRQQQVVGLVGSTGMSTGPHLHYEIRHHGRHINPLTLKLPPREPLPESLLPHFHSSIASVRQMLDGEPPPSLVAKARDEPSAT